MAKASFSTTASGISMKGSRELFSLCLSGGQRIDEGMAGVKLEELKILGVFRFRPALGKFYAGIVEPVRTTNPFFSYSFPNCSRW